MGKVNLFLKNSRHITAITLMIIISIAILFFCADTYAEPLKTDHPSLSAISLLIPAFICLIGLCAYILFIVLKTDALQTVIFFMVIIAAVSSIILPPHTVPDETAHYKTAYAYSNVLMGVSKDPASKTLLIRKCDWQNRSSKLSTQKYIKTFTDFEVFTDETELIEVEASFVSTSPFYVYIPQTIGITLGRILHLSKTVTFYLARLLNFVFYIIAFYFALKIIPFGKTAFAVIGLFPIAIQQAMSVSSDVFINAVAFLVAANALSFIYSEKEITLKRIVVFLVFSVLLAPCKIVYFALPFMTLLIPKEKLPSKPKRFAVKYLIPAAALITMLAIEFGNIASHMAKETSGTPLSDVPTYSIHYIFSDTEDFVLLVLRTLREYSSFYISSAMSNSLGSAQISTSSVLTVIFCCLLLLGLVPVKNDADRIKVHEADKLLAGIIIIGTAALVMLSMFTSWTPSNFDLIQGVQGRYLLPVLPLLIPIAYTDRLTASKELSRYVLFATVCTSLYTFLSAFCMAVITE
ncbi:MAG TPA: hypothetical protein DCR23_01885 [Ruminococcaceae bacterium]|nr:hypothetical protein [Oscillospiraceae bacterium]